MFYFTSLVTVGSPPALVQPTGSTYDYTDPTPPALNSPGQLGSLADGTTARLREHRIWIPAGLSSVRGVLINANAVDSDVRGSVTNLGLRAWCAAHGFALMGTKHLRRCEPTDETVSNTPTDGPDWRTITEALAQAATQASKPELVNAPFCCMGYSAGGQVAYGIATAVPNRVIATCANKGGFYNYPTTAQQVIPTLFITGGADTISRRQNITSRYMGLMNGNYSPKPRPTDSRFAWAEEPNIAHVWGNTEALLLSFFSEVVKLRYPQPMNAVSGQPTLLDIPEANGWLVDVDTTNWSSGYSGIYPVTGFGGNKVDYGWVPNEKIARLVRAASSYKADGNSAFITTKKYIRFNTPSNFLSDNTAAVYAVYGLTNIQFEVDPTITDWTAIRVYNGATLAATLSNKGSNVITYPMYFETTNPTHSVHLELDRPSGVTTSNIGFFVRGV